MTNVFKDMHRQNYLAMVVCGIILLCSIVFMNIFNKSLDTQITSLNDQVSDLRNKILFVETTERQERNDVIIHSTGVDATTKSQHDSSVITQLTNNISFSNGEGYNAVRDSLLTSLSESEIQTIMPANVLIGENLWQSDVDNINLAMSNFNSTCLSCDGTYSYFARVTLMRRSGESVIAQQNYLMTYSIDADGNMTTFDMYGII